MIIQCLLILLFHLQYFHNGADTLTDKFTLVARTSTKTSVPATVNIQIIPVNDEVPRVVKNTGIEVWAGSSTLITTDYLSKLKIFDISNQIFYFKVFQCLFTILRF